VVGPATKAKAVEMGFVNILGAESGSALALVDHIVKEKPDRLLLLTGDKNRDDLPLALIEAGIQFDQVQVYATNPNPNLQTELSQLNNPDWMVFFSPSGFDAVNVHLKDFPKIACIGKTTALHITSLGYNVTAVAENPEPASLYDAMFKI
jgi:uroporphyrinogen-III synthase